MVRKLIKKKSILSFILIITLIVLIIPVVGGCKKTADNTSPAIITASPTLAPTEEPELDLTKWIWAGGADVYAISDGNPDTKNIHWFHEKFFSDYYKGEKNRPYLAAFTFPEIVETEDYGKKFPKADKVLWEFNLIDDYYQDYTAEGIDPMEDTFNGKVGGKLVEGHENYPSARAVIDRFIANVKVNSPDAKFYIVKNRGTFYWAEPKRINDWITAYCDEKGITLIDPLNYGICNEEGKLKEEYLNAESPNGLHLNADGAAKVAEYWTAEMSK